MSLIDVGWSTKFLGREISRNIYFVFCEIIFLFREISCREILRNFAKFREISQNFCDEIKIFTGEDTFLNFIAFQSH
jgi:predicted AAA+ superfamily ATPase